MVTSTADTNHNLANGVVFNLPGCKTQVSIRHHDNSYVVSAKSKAIARWTRDAGEARTSQAMVIDERVCCAPVQRIELNNGQDDLESLWIAIYAIWLMPEHRQDDIIPIAVDCKGSALEYLCCTGLGRISPFEKDYEGKKDTRLLWLAHEAFWQGGGAPKALSWLQSRPEAKFDGFGTQLGVFPSQLSFTRKGNVCTVHSLRPPKPKPGSVVYSRFIVELQEHLEILHIDVENSVHFQAYKRWQNSDRVNAGWNERGSDEKHRSYLLSQLEDPHSMSCIFLWNGEPAGYCELGWAKEDNLNCFVSANCGIVLGEFDQNSHILVGEERFRGGKRYQAVATSIKHTCFLRDPRTQQVVAEPRIDLSSVPIQDRFLPQEKKKRFQLPHKEAMLFCLRRDRFFQEAHFV